MGVPKLTKDQLERIIDLRHGRGWLYRLAGGYRETLRATQCHCTEEEFLDYRRRAKEKIRTL